MDNICRQEIVRLHVFIEDWLTGTIEKSSDVFGAFADAFEDDFLIVHPSGQAQTKSQVTEDIWKAHGKRPKPFSIEIRNVSIRNVDGQYCLATYEEWQTGGNDTTRISSALFKKQPGGKTIRWLHLHETFVTG